MSVAEVMSVAEALPDTMLIGDLRFEVRESPRRAAVGVTVYRDGSLQLHAPAGCAPDALAAWAYSKRMWVYRKLAEKDLLSLLRPWSAGTVPAAGSGCLTA